MIMMSPLMLIITLIIYRPGSDAMYGFSKFICSLNELEEGVAPTDCRLRPDVRVMEQQDFDTANAEKVRINRRSRVKIEVCLIYKCGSL